MTTVLAAVGGVLLFLLKVLGILLLVVLALMVLLLLIPFCADVSWEQDTLTVKAGALGITFHIPVPEAGADGGEQAQKEAEKGKSGKEACQGEKVRRAAQKGKTDPEHPVHHPARSRDADPGCIRRAAHHPHPGMPWRARGGPCCSGPQLRQAAGMAIPGAGCA